MGRSGSRTLRRGPAPQVGQNPPNDPRILHGGDQAHPIATARTDQDVDLERATPQRWGRGRWHRSPGGPAQSLGSDRQALPDSRPHPRVSGRSVDEQGNGPFAPRLVADRASAGRDRRHADSRLPQAYVRVLAGLRAREKGPDHVFAVSAEGPDLGLDCLGDPAPRVAGCSAPSDLGGILQPPGSADRPAAPRTPLLSAAESGHCAVADQTPLELRDRAEHVEQEPIGGRGGVHGLVGDDEVDAERLELAPPADERWWPNGIRTRVSALRVIPEPSRTEQHGESVSDIQRAMPPVCRTRTRLA